MRSEVSLVDARPARMAEPPVRPSFPPVWARDRRRRRRRLQSPRLCRPRSARLMERAAGGAGSYSTSYGDAMLVRGQFPHASAALKISIHVIGMCPAVPGFLLIM